MKAIELLEEISRRKFLQAFGTGALALLGTHIFPKITKAQNTMVRNPVIYDSGLQMRVLREILEMKNLEYDPSKPLPNYISSDQVAPDYFIEAFGMPIDTTQYEVSVYLRSRNLIVLKPSTGIRDLAHELVHYIQYVYEGINPSGVSAPEAEDIENEAMRIGNLFQSRAGA